MGTPDLELAKDYNLPHDIISRLTTLPKPTRSSPNSVALTYPKITRWLAAIINQWGVSGYKTAAIVGMRSENNVRTAIKAYDAGAFDDLICSEEDGTNNFIDSTDTQYRQDFLDDAEADLEDLQKRYDALKRKYAILEKAAYTIGYVDAQFGRPMDKKYT